jgi:hypothetical protein
MYNTSNAKNVADARVQSEGKLTVNYFDGEPRGQGNNQTDSIQNQFKARPVGQKTIELSQEDDQTKGTWLPPAFTKYQDYLSRVNFRQYRGKIVHLYDKYNDQFVKLNEAAPGVIRRYWNGL